MEVHVTGANRSLFAHTDVAPLRCSASLTPEASVLGAEVACATDPELVSARVNSAFTLLLQSDVGPDIFLW